MGETQPQRFEIALAPGAAADIASALIEVLDRVAETRHRAAEAAEHAPAQTPYDLGLVPWTFHDPRQKVDVMAYVDDREQVRHVPTSRASEVPKAWRRVWLEQRD